MKPLLYLKMRWTTLKDNCIPVPKRHAMKTYGEWSQSRWKMEPDAPVILLCGKIYLNFI
jgi:hypothetical protein